MARAPTARSKFGAPLLSFTEGDAVLRLKDRTDRERGLLEMARGKGGEEGSEENENKQISAKEGIRDP